MKSIHYLKQLFLALLGRNPFCEELNEVTRAYEQTAERVQDLEKAYAKVEEKLEDYDQQVRNYQNLTENLRQRIVDKDVIMGRVKQDYQKRIEEYNATIDALRGEVLKRDAKIDGLREDLNETLEQLQRVNKDVGREMMNTNMLAKTNNALNDLCTAMESGNAELMLQAVEYLDWSDYMSRIIQQHLIVLRRKNELENRMIQQNEPKKALPQ